MTDSDRGGANAHYTRPEINLFGFDSWDGSALPSFGGAKFAKHDDTKSISCLTVLQTNKLTEQDLRDTTSSCRFDLNDVIPAVNYMVLLLMTVTASNPCSIDFDLSDAVFNNYGYDFGPEPARIIVPSPINCSYKEFGGKMVWLDMMSRSVIPAGTLITLSDIQVVPAWCMA